MRNSNHPIPMRYEGFLSSLLAYSQAISYDRIHSFSQRIYYTDNIWMLKFKDLLNNRFQEVIISNKSEMKLEDNLQEVCEYNSSTH